MFVLWHDKDGGHGIELAVLGGHTDIVDDMVRQYQADICFKRQVRGTMFHDQLGNSISRNHRKVSLSRNTNVLTQSCVCISERMMFLQYWQGGCIHINGR